MNIFCSQKRKKHIGVRYHSETLTAETAIEFLNENFQFNLKKNSGLVFFISFS